MKKTLSLLVCLAMVIFAPHTSAAEGEAVNMVIKISPGVPRANEPVIYEAVLSGGGNTNYQVGWFVTDPSVLLSATNTPPGIPELAYGLTYTNTFAESGLKLVTVFLQDEGTTNGFSLSPDKTIMFRMVSFYVQDSRDTAVTLLSPNGGEVWEVGKTYEITWNKSGSAKFVSIALEQKGNTNTPTLIAVYATNNGAFSFTVPFGTNWVTKGTEGNLNGKNYRVKVSTSPLGLGGEHDISDDWFTITTGTNPNAVPLSLRNLRFSMADIDVEGAEVGAQYRVESSVDLKQWRTNEVFTAHAESSTNSFPISGSPAQFFRLVKE